MRNYKVVIGLPVHNGENYLQQTIESILNQSFDNFKLLIGDNASTDNTESICNQYARQDSRIEYFRHPNNIGAAPNFNFLFRPENAPYFKWAAHDDILEADYLRQCIEILDQDSSVVIAHCPTFEIDTDGNKLRLYNEVNLSLNASTPQDRFWKILWTEHFTEIFGVMRSQVIAKSNLHGSFAGSDRNFFAEILLQGNVGYTAEPLFCRREHPESYMAALTNNLERRLWFDPQAKYPPQLTGFIKTQKYLQSIVSAPISVNEKIACLGMLVEFAARRVTEKIYNRDGFYRQQLIKNKNMDLL